MDWQGKRLSLPGCLDTGEKRKGKKIDGQPVWKGGAGGVIHHAVVHIRARVGAGVGEKVVILVGGKDFLKGEGGKILPGSTRKSRRLTLPYFS